LALKLKPIIVEKAKERQAAGGENKVVQNSAQPKTREVIAKKAGVSHDTITKTEKVLEAASEETKNKLRAGEISLNEAHKKTRI
jgi:hypothetical protein